MKKFLLFAVLFASFSVAAFADTVTLNLTAGVLANSSGVAIPDGALVQLLVDTSATFGAPTPASFTGTDSAEQVLASFSMDSTTSGVSGEFLKQIIITLATSGEPVTGNDLLLRWYPTLTTSSSSPGVGTAYGQFRTDAVENGSGIAWVIPAGGSTVALKFKTTTVSGSEPDSAGFANLTVVPEPATVWSALTGLAVAGGYLRRRRRA